MPVERIAHQRRQDIGRGAARGPCLPGDVDNPSRYRDAAADAELTARFEEGRWAGGDACWPGRGHLDEGWEGALYRTQPPARGPVTIRAVPYCVWDNRAPGRMAVWLPECA